METVVPQRWPDFQGICSCHRDTLAIIVVAIRRPPCLSASRGPASTSICKSSTTSGSTGRVQQQVIATLGRLDVLRKTGQLDALLASCARFAEHTAVLSAQRQGRVSAAAKVRIGPPLVFQRLWEELGLPQVLRRLLAGRQVRLRRGAGDLPHGAAPLVRSRQRPCGRGLARTLRHRRGPKGCNCTTSTAPWPGWASRCRRTNRPTPRPSPRVV